MLHFLRFELSKGLYKNYDSTGAWVEQLVAYNKVSQEGIPLICKLSLYRRGLWLSTGCQSEAAQIP
jgi:hypothetical protein